MADLAWNKIQQIPASIASSQLVSLNLSNNRLCNLQVTLLNLSQLPALRILLLKVCTAGRKIDSASASISHSNNTCNG